MKGLSNHILLNISGGSWFSDAFFYFVGYTAGKVWNGMTAANKAALDNGGFPMGL